MSLLASCDICPAQDTVAVKLVAVQPGVYRNVDDPQLTKGVFLYLYGEMLRQKPLTVQEIIARFNLINAIIDAQKEK